jgi:hypothetical protein
MTGSGWGANPFMGRASLIEGPGKQNISHGQALSQAQQERCGSTVLTMIVGSLRQLVIGELG